MDLQALQSYSMVRRDAFQTRGRSSDIPSIPPPMFTPAAMVSRPPPPPKPGLLEIGSFYKDNRTRKAEVVVGRDDTHAYVRVYNEREAKASDHYIYIPLLSPSSSFQKEAILILNDDRDPDAISVAKRSISTLLGKNSRGQFVYLLQFKHAHQSLRREVFEKLPDLPDLPDMSELSLKND